MLTQPTSYTRLIILSILKLVKQKIRLHILALTMILKTGFLNLDAIIIKAVTIWNLCNSCTHLQCLCVFRLSVSKLRLSRYKFELYCWRNLLFEPPPRLCASCRGRGGWNTAKEGGGWKGWIGYNHVWTHNKLKCNRRE